MQPGSTEDSFAEFDGLFEKAERHWRRGEYALALSGFKAILTRRLAAANDGTPLVDRLIAADMVVAERLADIAVLLNYAQAAADLLAGLTSLSLSAGNRFAADYYLLKRAHLALLRGRLREARGLLQDMQETLGDVDDIEFSPDGLLRWEKRLKWPGKSRADRAVILSLLYLVLGSLLAAIGQYGQSLVALSRGLAQAEAEDAPDLARQTIPHFELAIARALLEKGELSEARRKLDVLQEKISETDQPALYVTCLELSGKLNLTVGKLGEALTAFRHIYQICERKGFSGPALQAVLNLIHVQTYLNQTGAAKAALNQAKARAAGFGDEPALRRVALLEQLVDARNRPRAGGVAIAPTVTEMRGEARTPKVRRQAAPVRYLEGEESSSYLSGFEDYALNFQMQLGLGFKKSPAGQLALIKEIFQTTDSKLIRLRIVMLEGLLDYYHGDVGLAEEKLRLIRPLLSDLGMIPELWQLQRVLGWCWVRLKCDQQQRRELTEATEGLLNGLAASLAPEDRFIYLLNKWTADEEFIAAEIDHIESVNASIAEAPFFSRLWRRLNVMRRLNVLMQHIDSYKDALAKRTVEGTKVEMQTNASLLLWRRLWQHPRDRMTFSFLVLPDRVLVVRTGWLSLDYRLSPILRKAVRQTVSDWHHLMYRIENPRQLLFKGQPPGGPKLSLDEANKKASALAATLADDLQLPALLEGLPKRIEALTIIPDDSLHGFPFAAIVHEGKFLIYRYALSIAFESLPKRPPARQARRTEALLVGVSQGPDPLPGAASEVQQVQQWLVKRTACETKLDIYCLLNDSASKETVTEHLRHAAFLHVASHGVFHPDQPDSSGIVFTPQPDRIEVLSLRDFSQMDLAGLQHATIASCSAADHFILPGRWVISLPETLWRSGVGSILGCMWKVNDDLACRFAKRFYAHLEKLPRDQALRQTQLDFCKGLFTGPEGKFSSSPAHWACFNLYGNPGRLKLCGQPRTRASSEPAWRVTA
jgi:CHAT domain